MTRRTQAGAAIPVVVVDPDSREIMAGASLPVVNVGGSASTFDSIILDPTGTPPSSPTEGTLYWDATDNTLAVTTGKEDVTVQVGQEFMVRVQNETGVTITNGSVVYITSISGSDVPSVSLANASTIDGLEVMGLATQDIANGAIGFVTRAGVVRDIDTSGLSLGVAYLSATTSGALTSTDPSPSYPAIKMGQVLKVGATDGIVIVHPMRSTNTTRTLTFSMPLRSVVDSALNLTGEYNTIASAQTASYATDFAVSNNHVAILVNSITGTGDITITGTTIDETSAVPNTSATEVITVDSSTNQHWQTSAKWWEVTNIEIGAGITAINYDVIVVGYTDVNNQSFELLDYRVDMFAQGNSPDIRFLIYKVKDDGGGKMSLVTIEDIGVDSGSATNQIIDGIRTGANDRSYNPTVGQVWVDNSTLVLKQGDFNTYFTGGENIFLSGSANEGIIIRFEGSPDGSAISNVDYAVIQIRIRPYYG